jgi:6,7-dimethyl-8-ribityllumazine synthase
MSGLGSPEINVSVASDTRIVVVASSWHQEIMNGLVAGAVKAVEAAGATPEVHHVPGAFELSLAAQAAIESGADAVVALGVVIRGGTPHFDYVCHAVTDGINRVGLVTGVPIGFGVLTCDDEQQALDRAGLPGSKEDKGAEAATAAMAMLKVLDNLKNA